MRRYWERSTTGSPGSSCPCDDLDLLVLWLAHTHVLDAVGTTPRLGITSPLPEAGKTTCLEHLARLAFRPLHIASLSSPAMVTRLLAAGPRTLLVDEVDRNLNPDRDGVADLLAVLNSGYKRGATRRVLVPAPGAGWRVEELPTFASVAMAGISPHLPEDTASRTLVMVLLPDAAGVAEDSDWRDANPRPATSPRTSHSGRPTSTYPSRTCPRGSAAVPRSAGGRCGESRTRPAGTGRLAAWRSSSAKPPRLRHRQGGRPHRRAPRHRAAARHRR